MAADATAMRTCSIIPSEELEGCNGFRSLFLSNAFIIPSEELEGCNGLIELG